MPTQWWDTSAHKHATHCQKNLSVELHCIISAANDWSKRVTQSKLDASLTASTRILNHIKGFLSRRGPVMLAVVSLKPSGRENERER